MNPLAGLRVAYAPYTPSLDMPGDRRRFAFYARARGVDFELADPSERYDIVIVSSRGDITAWARYAFDETRIVFDTVNDYLGLPHWLPRNALRGMAKFATRENRHLTLDYRRAIKRMVQRADAVVCATDEQRDTYLPLCANVQIILDDHSELGSQHKLAYDVGDTVNIVWEGMPQTLGPLVHIAPALQSFAAGRACALHLVTSLQAPRYMGKYFPRHTETIARRLLPSTFVYQWNVHLFPAVARACDVAVVPVDLDDPISRGKPENRLLGFWRLGLPTLATASPAHTRAMDRAGLDLACTTLDDWTRGLERVVGDEAFRRACGEAGRAYVERTHNEEELLGRWDHLFETVLAPAGSPP